MSLLQTYMLIFLSQSFDFSQCFGLLILHLCSFSINLPDCPLNGSFLLLCFLLRIKLRLTISHIILIIFIRTIDSSRIKRIIKTQPSFTTSFPIWQSFSQPTFSLTLLGALSLEQVHFCLRRILCDPLRIVRSPHSRGMYSRNLFH